MWHVWAIVAYACAATVCVWEVAPAMCAVTAPMWAVTSSMWDVTDSTVHLKTTAYAHFVLDFLLKVNTHN